MQLTKYLLDVGHYTRRIKSCILLNHLAVSELTQEHFAELLKEDWLQRIVDHENYNPRVIASVSSDCLDTIMPSEYPGYILHALENPSLIWSKPYRSLSMCSKNLLVAMYFGSDFRQPIKELRANFVTMHRAVCSFHGQPISPSDFEDSLYALESGFIAIEDSTVRFINPSVKDFLKAHLVNPDYLLLLPVTAMRADWAGRLWSHVSNVFEASPEKIEAFASAFVEFAARIDETPTMVNHTHNGISIYSADDLSLSARVDLLIDWWYVTDHVLFLETARNILVSSVLDTTSRDGSLLPQIYWRVGNYIENEHVLREEILKGIESQLLAILRSGIPIDELITAVQAIQGDMDGVISNDLVEEIDIVVRDEFDNTKDAVKHMYSEDSLSEHLEYIDALAELTGYNSENAKKIVVERIQDLDEDDHDEQRTELPAKKPRNENEFSDEDLRSLFSCLIK